MQITAQAPPKPNAVKFVLPGPLFPAPLSFSDAAGAESHPLAAQIFATGQVYNVFMVQDFVTVNKLPSSPWDPLIQDITTIIEAYLATVETGNTET